MERPTVVTVLAILNFVLGGLFLCCTSFGTIGGVTLLSTEALFGAVVLLVALAGVLCSIALIVAGIGLLLLKEWGRKASIVAAIAIILVSMIDIAMGVAMHLGPMAQNATSEAEAVGMMLGGVVGVLCGAALRIAYPGVLLYFLYQPEIRSRFS